MTDLRFEHAQSLGARSLPLAAGEVAELRRARHGFRRARPWRLVRMAAELLAVGAGLYFCLIALAALLQALPPV